MTGVSVLDQARNTMADRWLPLIRFPLTLDLTSLLRYLSQSRLFVRVTEVSGQQQLWLRPGSDKAQAVDIIEDWYLGKLTDNELSLARPETSGGSPLQNSEKILPLLVALPVTFAMLLLGLVATALVFMDREYLSFAHFLLFQAFVDGQFISLSETLTRGDYWRLLSPMFLHFSGLHLLFNGLFIWVLGHRIERAKGFVHYVFLVICISLAANLAQYWVQGDTVFGGLSGVVYGLLAYIAVYQHFVAHPLIHFPAPAIAVFMVFLLLGLTGMLDIFIAGSIANGAHLAGLIAGAILGALTAIFD